MKGLILWAQCDVFALVYGLYVEFLFIFPSVHFSVYVNSFFDSKIAILYSVYTWNIVGMCGGRKKKGSHGHTFWNELNFPTTPSLSV